jgi:hypothetical protein
VQALPNSLFLHPGPPRYAQLSQATSVLICYNLGRIQQFPQHYEFGS